MKAEDIVKLPPKLFKFLAKWTADKIKEDALKGIFQNDVRNSQLREPYKSYKANWMRRRTLGEGKTFSDKEGYFYGKTYFRNKKAGVYKLKNPKGKQGKRLKAYAGVSIASNESRFSNMYLTGQTLNSIKQKVLTESGYKTGFVLSFEPRDSGKILGNRDKYGRDLVNISENNLWHIQIEIEKELGHNIDKFTSESININIG